ncbi:dTDP-4-dehydrorhamnose 3,5-epimerase [Marinococcus halotolerans]|uniref:dTDP-4-dehydrorhamnose 3,5-epimerase n=1 Tax=Marinococcus halotolerans TaxID=301092 RepID=UPI000488B95D|nr:dTDP-4-dehydrorhamnose 3,5-epimerase [Marinococcus halotolerans]
MKILRTEHPEVFILETKYFADNRGFFTESYNKKTFQELGFNHDFIQDNHSFSVEPHTIRGLHYQANPKAQTKLVKVIKGAVFDVAVDLRKDSLNYGKYATSILSENNKRQMLVPKGFAHGFCTLVKNTHVIYKVDEYYSKEHDNGIIWNDEKLAINWPTDSPILSEKDKINPNITNIN